MGVITYPCWDQSETSSAKRVPDLHKADIWTAISVIAPSSKRECKYIYILFPQNNIILAHKALTFLFIPEARI